MKKNLLNTIIIILGTIILGIIIYLLFSKKEESFLNVLAPNIIFVGESDNLKISSSNGAIINIMHGFLESNITNSKETNTNATLTGIKGGNEEITIMSNELVKKVDVLVCDKINLEDQTIEIVLGETKEIDFNISDKCLEQYDILVDDNNIISYSNNIITSKRIGTTKLIVSRLNEIHTYTITVNENIKNKELKFDIEKTQYKIGDKIDIPLINKSDVHTCSANNDIVNVSISDNGCMIEALKEGKTTIKAIDSDRTTEITIEIKNPIVEVDKIAFSNPAIQINKGKTAKLNIIFTPTDVTNKTITYTSNNPSIASVSNGTVTANEYGTTTITAKSNNGKTATISIIVTSDNVVAKYQSNTLNYWIDQHTDTYAITSIWVSDAYSQFKTAITSPKNINSYTPRIPQDAKTIITNTINEKGFQNKGLVGINASAMVSNSYGKKTPSNWFGTSQILLILNDGKVIRDSSREVIKTDEHYTMYGLKRNGDLTYYKYTKGQSKEQQEQNKQTVSKIINDGVLYTFGFKPVLLENGNVVDNTKDPNIRQAICQVDKNNFIFITNTSENRQKGFSFKNLAEKFKSLNCKTALNLDGGGSTCEYYKDNTNNLENIKTAYSGRLLSDMIYFVEK